uniref:Myb-like domain-containing protein n=1 Tax=Glycine max TaxID=3847 RepID=K7KDQ9_SOYBN|eukprot:XP_003522202.1 serine/threonine-protein kinase rio2 [Glycine max]
MATPPNDAASTKKPQPIPWTHQETVHLIRAYQEKWYALKRGPLRHNQWEEVAVVVAARCGYDLAHPAKSALQCRHKMEKLRQRHRAEKKQQHSAADALRPGAWQYNALMDDLERGPLPISALAPLYSDEEEDEDDDDAIDDQYDNDGDEGFINIKSKSINCILSERPVRMRSNDRGFLREHVVVVEEEEEEEEEEEVEEEEENENEDDDVLGLSMEMRVFAERFIGMESLKMEMMKETERCRLEMEKKRIQMILESQRRIVDSIGKAFGSSKRVKITQQN